MSIYSANRSAVMESGSVSIDDTYGPSSFGRIMYESAKNDMAVFEAVLASDFREMHAIREGTLLESELKALNEANVKEFFASVKAKLMKVWAKIKAAFKAAINKFAAYVLGDGKAFKKVFERTSKMYAGHEVLEVEGTFISMPASLRRVDRNFVEMYKDSKETLDKNEIVNKAYKDISGKECSGFADFNREIIELAKEEKTFKFSQASLLLDIVTNGKSIIKELKMESAILDKAFKGEIKALENAQNEIEGKETILPNISTAASAAETINTSVAKVSISLAKLGIKCARKILNEFMREMKANGTKNKNFVEGASLEDEEIEDQVANDEVEEIFDSSEEDVPADLQEKIDEFVESCN